jgi:hypothetical protein
MRRASALEVRAWTACSFAVVAAALGCTRAHLDDGTPTGLRDTSTAGAAGMSPPRPPQAGAGGAPVAALDAGGHVPDAGTADGGAAPDAAPGAAGAPASPPPSRDSGALDPKWMLPPPQTEITADDPNMLPVGIWVGESRDNLSCGHSTRLTLQITRGENGEAPRGVIVFGEAPFPTSIVDPEQAYPAGADEHEALCRMASPSEGFPYTLLAGQVSAAGRFDFRVAVVEPYVSWCALQPSYPSRFDETDYGCLPPSAVAAVSTCQSDPEHCPIPAGKFRLCMFPNGACLCFKDGCTANLHLTFRFDLRIEGTRMEGVASRLVFTEDAPVEVRLRRVE